MALKASVYNGNQKQKKQPKTLIFARILLSDWKISNFQISQINSFPIVFVGTNFCKIGQIKLIFYEN